MELFRIAPEEYGQDLSGNGAKLYGGRWNSEGLPALYTASSRSLALLETLVHASDIKTLKHRLYVIITIAVPDNAGEEIINFEELPVNWDNSFVQPTTVNIGDEFLVRQKNLLLKVPSVLVPEEFNYVINPAHPFMKRVKIVHSKFLKFNDRLFQ